MFDSFMMVALFALGMYLLVTSVQEFMGGNKTPQTIVYITIGAVLVAYNMKVVKKLFSS